MYVTKFSMPGRLVIFTDKCEGCNLCVEVCPVDVYIPHLVSLTDGKMKI
jgi:ferredoxin